MSMAVVSGYSLTLNFRTLMAPVKGSELKTRDWFPVETGLSKPQELSLCFLWGARALECD